MLTVHKLKSSHKTGLYPFVNNNRVITKFNLDMTFKRKKIKDQNIRFKRIIKMALE